MIPRKNKILLFFLFILPLYANDIYVASKDLPNEFGLLVLSLQPEPFDADEKKVFKKEISEFDSYLKKLSLQEITFTLKTEIIKFLLENPPVKFNPKMLAKPNHILKKVGKQLSPFQYWFLRSTYSDYEDLKKSSYLPSIILRIKKGSLPQAPNEKKIYNQLSLLQPHINHYHSTSTQEYQVYQSVLAQKLFKHLIHYFRYYSALSQRTASTQSYFTSTPRPTKDGKEPLLTILDEVEIPGEQTQKLEEQWVPKESILLLPTPDPGYFPPEKLPSPTKKWSLALEQIYPKVNPNYIPPKNLPTPIKNWIEKVPPTPTPAGDPDADWIIE